MNQEDRTRLEEFRAMVITPENSPGIAQMVRISKLSKSSNLHGK
jgi:hypothetical protein